MNVISLLDAPLPRKVAELQLDDEQQAVVARVLAERGALPGALLPVLHGVQDALGYVPDAALPEIARGLNLTRAEVYGVVTFYHHFRRHAPARHIVQICQAEACKAMGADALTAHAKASLGVDFHQNTADGAVTLLPVYCLGNCACSPSVAVGDDVHARVTPQKFDVLIAELREAAR
ncbi:MAG TPA: formate dehydrogenase subunit gamma [Candidatus Sulfotelmatobacter sp.]|nr:formate dehydrogenase subunit gamma [Candidatus Sulfotelmatobacter sp.]